MCLTDFQVETFGAFKVEGCIEIGDATEEVSKQVTKLMWFSFVGNFLDYRTKEKFATVQPMIAIKH